LQPLHLSSPSPASRFVKVDSKAEAVDFTRVLQAFEFAKNRAPGYNSPYFFDPLNCLSRDRS
jgi:hypothetical protein